MILQKIKAAGLDTRAALKNQQLNYAPISNLVQANLDGQRLAASSIDELQSSFADVDLLYLALKSLLPGSQDMEALARIRGFMRILQKSIERGAA